MERDQREKIAALEIRLEAEEKEAERNKAQSDQFRRDNPGFRSPAQVQATHQKKIKDEKDDLNRMVRRLAALDRESNVSEAEVVREEIQAKKDRIKSLEENPPV